MFGSVKLTKNADFDKYKYKDSTTKVSTQELDGTTLNEEKEYAENVSGKYKKLCLSLHYNGVENYLVVDGVEIYKFKSKDSEKNAALLCLGNNSIDFSADNTKTTKLYGYVYDFGVDYDSIDCS